MILKPEYSEQAHVLFFFELNYIKEKVNDTKTNINVSNKPA